MDGLLLVNKPTGISSFDVIRKLRQILKDPSTGSGRSGKPPRIGHAGTLDPMASGLMLLLFGPATKRASNFSKLDKTYEAEVTLGFESTTADSEGTLNKISDKVPAADFVHSALDTFVGQSEQTPPQFSAIKVGGKRAYKLARKGQKVEIPSRKVQIYFIRHTSYEYPKLSFEAKVSSGTYIRSLAVDIGQKLSTGAYLSALTRTKTGTYELSDAIDLETATADSVTASLREIRPPAGDKAIST